MQEALLELISSRDITRYQLGRRLGLQSLNMTPLYECFSGKRSWRFDYLTRILWTLNEIRTFSDSETDQIVQALLEAGTDES